MDMKQHPVVRRPHQKRNPEKTIPKNKPPRAQRINRILSLAGLASRRGADEFIKSGRVMVNGRIVREVGSQAIWGMDSIQVDGHEIPEPFERIYLMLNKPFGYISALSDPAGRPIVTHLLKDVGERVYPVGRLDFDSLGLLLFTNDGEWAHRLTHPKYHVTKTYKVTVEGKISGEALNSLRKGVRLEDGPTGPSKTTFLQQDGRKSLIRMTITTGKSRLVRRMLEAVGYRVVHLIRTGFGVIELGSLKIGDYRHLEPDEVRAMKKMVGMV
jgi:23S rRNA pseudouridine2605 synthase